MDIDDDVLLAVKDAAIRENLSVGRMMSKLARKALTPVPAVSRNGVLVFQAEADAPLITLEAVNRLRDEG